MKILLVYPYFLETRVHTAEDVRAVPLGVYYVASVLKENQYDVEVLNWYNIHATPHKISEVLAGKKPDVIGFSILHANRWGGIDIARIAKKIDPGVIIVFGGIGATFLWNHFLTHFREIDYVVIGEGEYTFLNLIQYIESDRSQPIGSIKGIAFRQDGQAVRTPKAEAIGGLDELPVPAKYFSYQHLSLTRGCAGNCNFCGSPQFWGNKVRFHSVGYFVDREDLYPWHANFYSRLAMTFDHGDYSHIEAIKNKSDTAENLYRRSLAYYPNARAYLGLGILSQKRRAYRESGRILSEGLSQFPEDSQLNICMGVNLMNLGEFEDALSYFRGFQDVKEAQLFAADCYKALGRETPKI